MNDPEIVSMMEALGYKMVRQGKEYHGNCPRCCDPEGEDRFVVFADGNAYCRRCGGWWSPSGFHHEFFNGRGSSNPVLPPNGFSSHRDRLVRVVSPKDPPLLWCRRAEELVNHASASLTEGTWGIQELERRNIRPDFEHRPNPVASGLGYIPKDVFVEGSEWGIEKGSLWIPQGLLIPSYHSIDCVKLKVRRQRCDDGLPKYIEISGSSNRCLVLGYYAPKVAMVVESELDAILCMQEASDLVWTVAVGGASKPVDEEADGLFHGSSLILFSLDQDSAGRQRYGLWRERYPQLRAWPADRAKSPGDMRRESIRPWIERGIEYCFRCLKTR